MNLAQKTTFAQKNAFFHTKKRGATWSSPDRCPNFLWGANLKSHNPHPPHLIKLYGLPFRCGILRTLFSLPDGFFRIWQKKKSLPRETWNLKLALKLSSQTLSFGYSTSMRIRSLFFGKKCSTKKGEAWVKWVSSLQTLSISYDFNGKWIMYSTGAPLYPSLVCSQTHATDSRDFFKIKSPKGWSNLNVIFQIGWLPLPVANHQDHDHFE